ncbi:MAG: hypothetical protein ACTSRW_06355 [Candidatus Helarchaeota archaeon]
MRIPYESTRAKKNMFCGVCEAFIGEGDMYLLDKERLARGEKDAILCHFCNYKRSKKNLDDEKAVKKASQSGDFKAKVSRLDDLISKAINESSKESPE